MLVLLDHPISIKALKDNCSTDVIQRAQAFATGAYAALQNIATAPTAPVNFGSGAYYSAKELKEYIEGAQDHLYTDMQTNKVIGIGMASYHFRTYWILLSRYSRVCIIKTVAKHAFRIRLIGKLVLHPLVVVHPPLVVVVLHRGLV